jgi:ABC-type Fe3+/spermidine/putrescine transport system ATPase subunit
VTGSDIVLTEISKSYGDVVALHAMSLSVQPGEFLSLLGPSGCGKSTTLGIIAGFLRSDTGVIAISGMRMNEIPAH